MVDKEAIKQRAREWMGKNVPAKCPNINCTAVNQWKLGEVGEVFKAHHNKEEGHAKAAPDDAGPNYVVPIICGWCRGDFYHYEEE